MTINSGLDQFALERVLRELFPLAVADLESQGGSGRALQKDRAEYSVWLREEEYTSGLDTRSAVLCVLKLRSKTDGSVYATTIVADDTKHNIRSSGYLHTLLCTALQSLSRSVAASGKAARAAAK